MKIIKLQAENIKKLTAVEITPNGNIVEIVGPNGSGKSSVLDAIYYALSGAAVVPNQVVRQGEEKAHVKLDLGELIITRGFTAAGGTTLRVEAANGARFPSPQRMLDDLVGSLSFDPLAFTRLGRDGQLKELKDLLPELKDRLEELRETRVNLAEHRRSYTRDLKQVEVDLGRLPDFPADLPESIDLNAIIVELDTAGTSNTMREHAIHGKKILEGKIEDNKLAAENRKNEAVKVWDDAVEQCKKIMTNANAHRVRLLEECDRLNAERKDRLEVELANLPAIPEKIDTAPLIARSTEAQRLAGLIGQKHTFDNLIIRRRDLQNALEQTEADITGTETEGRKLVAEATMPIPGLSLGETEVLYQGRPLENASSSEQLRVSVAIAMAKNPRLRVLRIKDGSLLDTQALTELRDMANTAGYQVWIERVDGTTHQDRPCIVMEDGHVLQEVLEDTQK